MGRPTKPIELTEEERDKLQQWARRPKIAQRLALRHVFVLGCADGLENRQVARQIHMADQTACKWRERFRTARLKGLVDEPRPRTPRKITDVQVEALITRTLEITPEQSTHWSTRTMAQSAGMSQSAVSSMWRAFALQPHRTETFKLSSDPFFIEKVRDTVVCICTLRFVHWCCAWTRRPKSRLWIGLGPSYPCDRVCPPARVTITSVTGPPLCSRPWMCV
jgi:transposase